MWIELLSKGINSWIFILRVLDPPPLPSTEPLPTKNLHLRTSDALGVKPYVGRIICVRWTHFTRKIRMAARPRTAAPWVETNQFHLRASQRRWRSKQSQNLKRRDLCRYLRTSSRQCGSIRRRLTMRTINVSECLLGPLERKFPARALMLGVSRGKGGWSHCGPGTQNLQQRGGTLVSYSGHITGTAVG